MKLSPSWRVRKAMARISRNKYLSPDDVIRIGHRLSELVCYHSKNRVYDAAVPLECNAVGMLNGMPLFYRDEIGYSRAVNIVKTEKNELILFVKLLKIQEGIQDGNNGRFKERID